MSDAPREPWWRHPALRFALLGGALFAVDRWRAPRHDPRALVVRADYVRALRDELTRRHGAPPSAAALRAEVDRYVREEVLVREALALGLDRGDAIVRRRLVQKMEFALEDDASALASPGDDVLARYLRDHAARYAEPGRVTFAHAFFDRATRGPRCDADARAALTRADDASAAPPGGDPFALGAEHRDLALERVARDFDEAFARALVDAPLGRWSGPVASRWGIHLVRVTARTPGAAPPLDAVRERVLADWRADARTAAAEAAWRRLAAAYHVRVEAP